MGGQVYTLQHLQHRPGRRRQSSISDHSGERRKHCPPGCPGACGSWTRSGPITFRSDGVAGQRSQGFARHGCLPFARRRAPGESGCGAAPRGRRSGRRRGGRRSGRESGRSFPAPTRLSAGKKKNFSLVTPPGITVRNSLPASASGGIQLGPGEPGKPAPRRGGGGGGGLGPGPPRAPLSRRRRGPAAGTRTRRGAGTSAALGRRLLLRAVPGAGRRGYCLDSACRALRRAAARGRGAEPAACRAVRPSVRPAPPPPLALEPSSPAPGFPPPCLRSLLVLLPQLRGSPGKRGGGGGGGGGGCVSSRARGAATGAEAASRAAAPQSLERELDGRGAGGRGSGAGGAASQALRRRPRPGAGGGEEAARGGRGRGGLPRVRPHRPGRPKAREPVTAAGAGRPTSAAAARGSGAAEAWLEGRGPSPPPLPRPIRSRPRWAMLGTPAAPRRPGRRRARRPPPRPRARLCARAAGAQLPGRPRRRLRVSPPRSPASRPGTRGGRFPRRPWLRAACTTSRRGPPSPSLPRAGGQSRRWEGEGGPRNCLEVEPLLEETWAALRRRRRLPPPAVPSLHGAGPLRSAWQRRRSLQRL